MMKVFKYLCVASIFLGSLIIYESRLESDPMYNYEIILIETQKDLEHLNIQMINDPLSRSHSHFLCPHKFSPEVNLKEGRE